MKITSAFSLLYPRNNILVLALFAIFSEKLTAQANLISSDIPIVVINTNNLSIPDDPKIMADMGIIYNGVGIRNYMTDPFNDYNGKIGIERRGSSSQSFHPKKSYAFECWDNVGNTINLSILGMPAESDWCLIANYIDKSLTNNALTYSTWEEMGWWGPRNKQVELVLNGTYQGVYLLVEKIKRDSARVAIAKLLPSDTTGDELTGGYILKVDQLTGNRDYGWYSLHQAYGTMATGQYPYYACIYPDSNSIQPQQANYITAYVDSFETALITHQYNPQTGWQKYADLNSFVDYFLIQELSRNVDGYRASTYFYKDKNSNEGKLTMGLVWDYDRGWDNASYGNGWDENGWDWSLGDFYYSVYPVPDWWGHLLQDTSFTKALRCRWEQLKFTTLGISHLHAYCDSMALYLNESQQRNFTQWPILGIQVFPNPVPVPTTYQGEINELKTWITNRWAWLDANIPGTAVNCSFVDVHTQSELTPKFSIYPNPGQDILNLHLENFPSGKTGIDILDISGRLIQTISVTSAQTEQTITINVSALSEGIYFIHLRSGNDEFVQKFDRQ